MDVMLTSTHHDADARLLYMFEDCTSKLRELYSGMSVAVSPLTHESARRRLIGAWSQCVYVKGEWPRLCLP